ncbi:MAG: copper resistance protein NlpE N-terminal domain-containing protein [Ignavibacteriae bacterium]|nr:copper resistance protein NlpE N-terminal domain-containing protein [Ignavibacteriota bacterium]
MYVSFVTLLFSLAFILSCSTKTEIDLNKNVISTADNSSNSVDWEGTYTGILPCADCEGIETQIVLKQNMTYLKRTKYLGKSEEYFKNEGNFIWNDSGNIITLQNIKDGASKFLVGENKIIQLDMDGNRISGILADKYIITKLNNEIVEKYWKLIELNGKRIQWKENQQKELHFILKMDNKIIGFGGCNSFSGNYELKDGNRISFTNIASTLMACENMETESQFFKVLNTSDNFNFRNDTLTLNKARMAPLAKFEAVYLK